MDSRGTHGHYICGVISIMVRKKHHLIMAEYCIGYLYTTMKHPLVLGGPSEIKTTGYTDASLATGPKSNRITGQIIKLDQ